VLAIELLAACQALEFVRPLTTTAPLEAVYELVRSIIPSVTVERCVTNYHSVANLNPPPADDFPRIYENALLGCIEC